MFLPRTLEYIHIQTQDRKLSRRLVKTPLQLHETGVRGGVSGKHMINISGIVQESSVISVIDRKTKAKRLSKH